jgi:predicted nucleic acid-binding protein
VRALKLRLLGDAVMQNVAWRLADELGWTDTYAAEYLALTKLQADAFVTLDKKLARAAAKVVPVATLDELLTARPAS